MRRRRDERQLVASGERADPQHRAEHQARGCSAAASPGPQASAARRARSSISTTSTPATAPGAMPKFESAEYRPPIVSRPCSTARKPSALRLALERGAGIGDGHEPRGRPAPPTASRALRKEVALQHVRLERRPRLAGDEEQGARQVDRRLGGAHLGRIGRVQRRAAAAPPFAPLNVSASTSGARLDPPIPSSRAWSRPVRARLVGKPAQVAGAAQLLARDVQPAQPAGLVTARSTASRRRPTGAPPSRTRSSPRAPPPRPPGVGRQRELHTASAILTRSFPLLSPE